MKKILLATLAFLWLLTGLGGRLVAQENIAVWQFPLMQETSDPVSPSCVSDLIQSTDCELTVATDGWTFRATDYNNTNTVLCGDETNATTSKGLRLTNSNGNFTEASIIFKISTAPYGSIRLNYDHRIAAVGGYETETWSYSTNGVSFTEMTSITGATTTYATEQVDFSSVSALNGLQSVWFKLTVSGATVDNAVTAIDNVVFTGSPMTCLKPDMTAVADDAPTEAVVSWTPAGDNEESYTLVYGTSSLNATVLNTLVNNGASNVIANATSPYTLTGLTANTTYYIYVRANCGGDDNSLWANATVTTPAVCAVSGLAASEVTGSSATLSWTTTSENTMLRIFTSAQDNPWEAIGFIVDETVTGNTYNVTGLNSITTYYVYAKAVCSANNVSEQVAITFTTDLGSDVDLVTIGTGSTTNSYLPTYCFYNYSLTEQIYTPEEIGTPGTIARIAFYCTSGLSRTMDIYMLNTSKETFTGSTDWVAVSAGDRVFSGSVTFTANAWTTINLTTPFAYDGTSNLLIAVDDNTGSYVSSVNWRVFDATSKAIRVYSDGTNYNPTSPSSYSGSVLSVKNQIQLTIVPPPATCPKPVDLAAGNVTATSASITWLAGGEETAWALKYGPAGFDVETDGTEVAIETTPSYELTGLTANTAYDVYVKAVCSDTDESGWRKVSFATPCIAITEFPWTEGFESLTAPGMPSCWTVVDANEDGDYWKTFTDYGNPGISVGLYTDYNNGSNNDYLILPAFELNGSYVFSYDVRARSTSEPNDYRVLLSVTGNSPEDFTVVLKELETVNYTTYQTKDINLNGYNGTVYIAIHVPQGGLDGYYIYFDNFKIREASTAAEITAFSFAEDAEVAVINSTDATVTSLVSYSTESLNGLVPTIAVSENATIAPASGVAQDFTGPVTYTVTAEDGTTTKEWTVNVSKVETASSAKDILSFTFSGQSREADIDVENHTVTAYAAWNYDFANNIAPTITVSPQATIYPVSDSSINFATPVTYTVTAEDESTQQWTVTIINDPNACVNPLPATFVVSDLTSSTATVAWERRYTETSYNVKVSTTAISVSDIATTDGDVYNGVVNDTTITLTGLTENTMYYVYVQSACGIETWVSKSFRTIITPATIPYIYAFEDATENEAWVLINGTQTNKWYIGTASSNSGNGLYISNNGTSYEYSNTLSTISAYRTVSFPANSDYVISFDWKAYGESCCDYLRAFLVPADVAINENSDNGISATATPAGWFDISQIGKMNVSSSWQHSEKTLSLDAGLYNMVFYWRNDGSLGTQPPASVDNISITQITCPIVSNLEASNMTTTSADITWTERGTATAWDVVFSAEELDETQLAAATPEELNAASYQATGLTQNTPYYIYVRAHCSAEDQSEWVAMQFRTECGEQQIPYSQNFNEYTATAYSTAGVMPDCWSYIYNGTNTAYAPHVSNSTSYSPMSGDDVNYLCAIASTSATETYGNDNIIMLPPVEGGYASRTVSFAARTSSSTNAAVKLGYMNGNSFENLTDVAFASAIISFSYVVPNTVPEGAKLALKFSVLASASSTVYYGIDNVVVRETSTDNTILSYAASTAQGDAICAVDNDVHTISVELRAGATAPVVIGQTIVLNDANATIQQQFADNFITPPNYFQWFMTAADTTVVYKVTAENGAEQLYNANITVESCAAPSTLVAEQTSLTNVNCSWTPAEGTTAWNFYCSTTQMTPAGLDALTASDYTTVTTASASATVVGETTYYWYVRTDCSGSYSAWLEGTFTTWENCVAPTNLATEVINDNNIVVSWNVQDNLPLAETNISDNFERGTIAEGPFSYSNDATYPWQIVNYDGTSCIKSSNGGVPSSQSTITMTYTASADVTLSFKHWVMGEGTTYIYDYLIFTLDGVATNYTGTINENTGWSTATHNLSAGTHTMTWTYRKDGSTDNTGDCAYIDDITIFGSVPGGNSSVVVYKNDAELATVPATQTSYTDEGLEAGNYCYKVKTICREGSESDFSAPVCQDVNACMAVTNMSATNVTPYSATISWTRGTDETAWNLTVNGGAAVALTEASEGVTVNANVITYALAGLEPMTTYTVTIQSDCGGSVSQSVTSVEFTTDRVPATLPYTCGFEDAAENNGWVLLNGTQTNKWYIGTAAYNSGTHGLYISNDEGASNNYSTGSASYVFAYRTINVENASDYTIAFSWKAYAESCCDYIRAFLVPADITINANASNGIGTTGAPTNWIAIDGGNKLNYVSSWQNVSNVFSIENAGYYNLVFYWRNDGSSGTMPPAIIDNVSVIEVSCPTVASLVADPADITDNSAVITWVERGPATNWEVIVSTTEVTDFASATTVPVTEPSYSATGLDAETLYHVYVRANCGTDENSDWVSSTFSTVAACATPDGLVANNVSATSATITWNGYTASQWTLEYRIGTTGDWTPVTDLAAATYTMTTTGNTTYNVRIKAVCGVDVESDYSAILSFTTPCEALTVDEDNPYIQDFETTTAYALPDCWERIASYTSGSYTYPCAYSSTTYSHASSSRSLRMYTYYYNNAPENVVAMPRMNDINTLQVSFWARYYSTNPQSFQIGYVKNGVFTSVQDFTLTATHQQFTVYMSEVPADAEAIAFRSYHATSSSYVHIDDINVSVIPSCVEPADIVVSNITNSSASISWTDVNPATAWQYQLNNGEIFDIDAKPIELTGLTTNTTYTIKVRTVCGVDEYSAWTSETFRTECDVILVDDEHPFTEDFESGVIPGCWSEETSTTHYWVFNQSGTNDSYSGAHTGSYNASYRHVTSGDVNKLVSPILDFGTETSAILDFWRRNPSWAGDIDQLRVYYRTSTSAQWNLLASYTNASSDWTNETITLPNTGSTYQIAFEATDDYGYGLGIDDITVHVLSSAAEITAFSFAEDASPAVINSADATVTSVVSYSTASLNGLVPTITVSDYATISPASGMAQDFSSPVTYVVTAGNGTTKEWTVNVSKMENASSEKDILSFSFNGQVGESVIDATAHTVTAAASWNISLESVTPAIEVSPLATINPASGVSQDFSTPVTYVVTAEDESAQEWIVTITQDSESLASLPYSCDFEDATENSNWVLDNGTQTNKWYIGTAANNGGANGLYISNTDGATNNYVESETYVYAYRLINVEEAGHYDFSFDWRSYGEYGWDLLRAFAIPTAINPDLSAGNSNGMGDYNFDAPNGWIDIANPSGQLSEESDWQHSEKAVALETGAYNLVFLWLNDDDYAEQTPAAIDNVSVVRSTFTINASVGGDGYGTIDPSGEFTVADGATQTFTMTPWDGFALSSFMVNGVESLSQVVNNTYTIESVDDDYTVVATFEPALTITATAGNGGSINPSGAVLVGAGANYTFTVTADEGYIISSVLVDGTDEQIAEGSMLTSFNYTFSNVTEDHTITASFVSAQPHVITATAGNGGSISPSGQVSVPYNGSQTFVFTADEGYSLANIVVDNGPATAENNTYTFTNVIADHTINANFAVNNYNLTVHYVYADNTTAAPDHTESFAFGAEYSVESPVIAGYTADQLTVAGTMPAQDVDVTVTYNVNSYTLTIHYVYADNTTAAPDHTESVAYGADYSVESPVVECYTADQLTVAGTMPAQDVEVNVIYNVDTYTLTVHYVYADNTEAATTYTETVACGTAYSVPSPAIDGYTANPAVVEGTMPAQDVDVTVTYNEIVTHTLTIHYVYAETNAQAAADHTETLAEGAAYSVTSPVIDGYTADQTVVAGTMGTADVEVTVTYTANTHTLTIHYVYAETNAQAAADYTETLAEGAAYSVTSPVIDGYTASQTVVEGTMGTSDIEVTVRYTSNTVPTYTLTIHYVYAETNAQAAADHTETLAEGAAYSVTSPVIDGYTADQATVAGTMPAQNVEVTVRYTANTATTYTITATAGNGGAINPNGTVTVNEGADQPFTITADAGYRIESVLVDGADAISELVNNVYTFVNVTSNHTIAVTFAPVSSTTYTIIATAGSNGTITPNGVITVAEGATQTFRIAPNEGYRIASVMVDNVEAITDVVDNEYVFYNVTANHTINVTFTDGNAVDEYTTASMSVYPNPNNGMFSIDFSRIEGDATYQLIDARGAVVETRDINVMDGDTMNFNHDLRPGTYFVRIVTADKVYVEQIVVE